MAIYVWHRLLTTLTSLLSAGGGGSSCGRLWCCSCRVVSCVVLVVCVLCVTCFSCYSTHHLLPTSRWARVKHTCIHVYIHMFIYIEVDLRIPVASMQLSLDEIRITRVNPSPRVGLAYAPPATHTQFGVLFAGMKTELIDAAKPPTFPGRVGSVPCACVLV